MKNNIFFLISFYFFCQHYFVLSYFILFYLCLFLVYIVYLILFDLNLFYFIILFLVVFLLYDLKNSLVVFHLYNELEFWRADTPKCWYVTLTGYNYLYMLQLVLSVGAQACLGIVRVRKKIKLASRNMVQQHGSESHNHLPPFHYGLVVFA